MPEHRFRHIDGGVMYDQGIGVPEDDAEAVRWCALAAEQGHAKHNTISVLCMTKGDGVPEDDAEAVRWYQMAAEQGHAGAQTNLGFMYYQGDGVPEDAYQSRALVSSGS